MKELIRSVQHRERQDAAHAMRIYEIESKKKAIPGTGGENMCHDRVLKSIASPVGHVLPNLQKYDMNLVGSKPENDDK